MIHNFEAKNHLSNIRCLLWDSFVDKVIIEKQKLSIK